MNFYRRRKRDVKKVVLAILTFLAGIILFDQFGNYWKPQLNCTLSNLKPGNKKLILLWTRGWRRHNEHEPLAGWNIDENTLKNCPFTCDFTDDKNVLNVSDALVFHGFQSVTKLPQRSDLCQDQIWTFLNIESPSTTLQFGLDLSGFDNQFNWTATYRMDSDVPSTYGSFHAYDRNGNSKKAAKLKFPTPIPTIDSIRNKSLIGWMHSNCKATSHRVQLAEQLKKYVHVDIFGKCSRNGRLNCTLENKCYKNFTKHYKFWLAFENSICPDYVTEKLFYPLAYGMVPIVYAHKSVLRFLPKDSFINIWDFATIEELAKYLLYLDQNPEEYLKYFEWRKEFWVDADGLTTFWCAFCTKLSTYDISNRKYYKSIHDWYFHNYTSEDQCPPTSGFMFDSTFDIWGRAF